MKTGVLLQARMGSHRLPGKVLLSLPFAGRKRVIEHIESTVAGCTLIDSFIVATTTESADDVIADLFPGRVFRGSADDVLARFHHAAQEFALDLVVRVTGDNPCVRPEMLDALIRRHVEGGYDYSVPQEVPLGLHAEVFPASLLARLHTEAQDPYEREHVTPYFYRHPELFSLGAIPFEVPEILRRARLTLDYPSDYAMLNVIFTRFPDGRFTLEDLSAFLEENPWLIDVNRNYQKSDHSPEAQIREAIALLEDRELRVPAEMLRATVAR